MKNREIIPIRYQSEYLIHIIRDDVGNIADATMVDRYNNVKHDICGETKIEVCKKAIELLNHMFPLVEVALDDYYRISPDCFVAAAEDYPEWFLIFGNIVVNPWELDNTYEIYKRYKNESFMADRELLFATWSFLVHLPGKQKTKYILKYGNELTPIRKIYKDPTNIYPERLTR